MKRILFFRNVVINIFIIGLIVKKINRGHETKEFYDTFRTCRTNRSQKSVRLNVNYSTDLDYKFSMRFIFEFFARWYVFTYLYDFCTRQACKIVNRCIIDIKSSSDE